MPQNAESDAKSSRRSPPRPLCPGDSDISCIFVVPLSPVYFGQSPIKHPPFFLFFLSLVFFRIIQEKKNTKRMEWVLSSPRIPRSGVLHVAEHQPTIAAGPSTERGGLGSDIEARTLAVGGAIAEQPPTDTLDRLDFGFCISLLDLDFTLVSTFFFFLSFLFFGHFSFIISSLY